MRNLVPTSHRKVAAAGLLRELAFDITRNLSLELQWPLNVNLDMNMDLALDLNLDLMLNVILNLHTHTHTHTHARVLFPSQHEHCVTVFVCQDLSNEFTTPI